MIRKAYYKYGLLIAIIILLIISVAMIWPYMTSILSSFILAYVLYPFYAKINKKIKNKNIASLITCILIIFVLLLPFIFTLNKILIESTRIYGQALDKASLTEFKIKEITDGIYQRFGVNVEIHSIIQTIFTSFGSYMRGIVSVIPGKLFSFFIVFFMLFFLFRDGKKFSKQLSFYVPLHPKEKKKLFKELKAVTKGVLYGHVVTAMVQGIIGSIGFLILGVGSPTFYGVLMFLFALIPFVGTPIVYVPVALSMLLTGLSTGDSWLIARSIILLLYGVLFISTIDNFLKPKLIGDQVKVHTAVIILGIIGGIHTFGIMGILIGPLILSVTLTLLNMYGLKKKITEEEIDKVVNN